MKTVEQAGKIIKEHLAGKKVLEIACGGAEFSMMASTYAIKVECVDVDDSRLSREIGKCSNVRFQKMDATRLAFSDGEFDTVIAYNAIAHLSGIIPQIVTEGLRVLDSAGVMIVISSWSLDKPLITDALIPFLLSNSYKYLAENSGKFCYVIIAK